MRINEQNKTMDMEARDLNYILPAYLRSYQFHSKNELPTKIIFPMFPSVKAANGVDIPIEYVPPLDKIATEIQKDGSNVAEITPEQEAVLDEKDEEIKKLKADMEKLQTSIIQQKGTTLSPEEVDSLTQTGRGGEEMGGTALTEPIGVDMKEAEEVLGGTRKEATTSEQLEDESADLKLEEDTEPKTLADEMPDEEPEVSPTESALAEPTIDERVSKAKSAFKVDPDPAHQPKPDRKPKQPPGGDIGAGQALSGMQPRGRDDQKRTARDLLEEPEIEGTPEKEFGKEIKRDKKGKPIVEDKPESEG